jgi:CheY-like chemotaxis protein
MSQTDEPGKTLLIVEDDAIAREGLAAILRRAGYQVVPVADGLEALEYLRREPAPSLILLDMMLRGLDGWTFLREKERDSSMASIPVIIMTGMTSANLEWANCLGAVGLLSKPIEVKALLEEINRHA